MNIKISVIMPVYNADLYLAEAIESVLMQTYKYFEFIIINDGSSDNSLNIIKSYMLNDSRIALISRENRGLIASLNEGVSLASGKYIARMDADDICLQNRFEKQLSYMENNKTDVCGCHFYLISKSGALNGLKLTPLHSNTIILALASEVPFAHPSVMIKREFLSKHSLLYGQSNCRTAEDFDLWIRMFEKNASFGNVDDVLFKYRVLNNSVSRRNAKGIRRDKKSLNKSFIRRNKKLIFDSLDSLPDEMNKEEKSLVVRVVLSLILKKFRFSFIHILKAIEPKIIVQTFFSKLLN